MAATASTMAADTRVWPSVSLWWFSGSVASSPMSTHRSRHAWVSWRSSSPPGSHSERATPMTAWASSTAPTARGWAESLGTRPPNSSPVVPSSPLPVYSRVTVRTLPLCPVRARNPWSAATLDLDLHLRARVAQAGPSRSSSAATRASVIRRLSRPTRAPASASSTQRSGRRRALGDGRRPDAPWRGRSARRRGGARARPWPAGHRHDGDVDERRRRRVGPRDQVGQPGLLASLPPGGGPGAGLSRIDVAADVEPAAHPLVPAQQHPAARRVQDHRRAGDVHGHGPGPRVTAHRRSARTTATSAASPAAARPSPARRGVGVELGHELHRATLPRRRPRAARDFPSVPGGRVDEADQRLARGPAADVLGDPRRRAAARPSPRCWPCGA